MYRVRIQVWVDGKRVKTYDEAFLGGIIGGRDGARRLAMVKAKEHFQRLHASKASRAEFKYFS